MRLYAFQGIRYGPAAAGDGDPGALAAPPYDQIDDRLRDQLQGRSAHHFAHLNRPKPPAGGDPYRHAADLHREWLEAGVLVREEGPALFPYEIRLASGGRRRGVCGLVGLESPESGLVRPHEATLDKPLRDRLELLRAMRVDLEPILLLADDGGGLDRLLGEDLERAEALVQHRDPSGNRHLLYRLGDRERIASYRELLGPRPGLIADGHHRYKVASLFADETDAEPDSAVATKLAVVTSLASPELTIDPIHRALRAAPDLAALGRLATSRRPWEGTNGHDLAAGVTEAPQPALGVWASGQSPEVWMLEPREIPGLPAAAGRLPVVLLHRVLLPAAGLGAEAAIDGTVVYHNQPESLFAAVSAGEAAVGFWLPPMRAQEFAAAIAHGDLLPPKSTRFLPKVVSGLVWADHGSELG